MAARDTLSEGMASLEAHLAEADKGAQTTALQVLLGFGSRGGACLTGLWHSWGA